MEKEIKATMMENQMETNMETAIMENKMEKNMEHEKGSGPSRVLPQ